MEKNILVIGAARSGIAVCELLLKEGKKTVLTDTGNESEIIQQFPQLEKMKLNPLFSSIFGIQVQTEILKDVERIIISPGVPLTIPIVKEAYSQGITVIGEVELAYELTETPFTAITGTNGKTTTTTLLGEIFKASGRKTYVVGNIGDPITNYVGETKADAVFVTEISSFQLETIREFRPRIAGILNITPDHLDRHLTMENYIEAKGRVFENQKPEDLLVINGDDPIVVELAKKAVSKKAAFSYKNKVDFGAWCLEGKIYLKNEMDTCYVCDESDLGIIGPHNTMNALAALLMAYHGGVSLEVIVGVLKTFKGVEHRLEHVGVFHGVTYINDSKGTNTSATMTAINAINEPIVLIAGGYDKKEDYSDLMDIVRKKVKTLILLGATADDLLHAAESKGVKNIIKVEDYEAAVALAKKEAATGETVLLSPACASWDMYPNYEIRGKVFKELVVNS
ncbi:MAG: UDP-N-acetylmuramoyl-L-alanine--D-glutamate ligase [Eubacteriaceae bacterium]